MTDILALEKMYYDCGKQFRADKLNCELAFGWNKAAAHQTGPRIVWVPGDPNGSLGDIVGAMHVGTIPRPLFTLNEHYHCIVSGYGSEQDPTDELLAWKVTRLLYDQLLRAMQLTNPGMFQLLGQEYVRAGERDFVRYGTAILARFYCQAAVMDIPPDGGFADLTYPEGEIDLTIDGSAVHETIFANQQ